ncbi:sensor histidine kinase [Bacillus sp. HMF5848]|uniref:sensor histidine kinase n=1 Tax=Bacillus sp. HMF5848 TaxID=2495421 RepID=UPI000F7ABBC1|nr:sensor histidine kinase [Bacillus sp. HMF5848]RSK26334.1 sensor histidine kinase [Bacillus sp. HMF5848]
MFQKIRSIRYLFVKSHIYATAVTAIILYAVVHIASTVNDIDVPLTASLLFLIVAILLSIMLGAFIGFRNSYHIKTKLEDVSTYIATLSRGTLSKRMDIQDSDEIGRIAAELNMLAAQIEGQVWSLQKLANEKADLAQKAHAAAIIEERQRLARDLHDAVSQQLFALSMMSSAVIRLQDRNPEMAKKQMAEIAEIASKAQGEMRALLLHLRPVHLSNDTLDEGVRKLVEELQVKTNILFRLQVEKVNLPHGTEDHLFRIIQEALSNILRHSDATTVTVQITNKPKSIHVFIGDNGKGFDITETKVASYGLRTMKERCYELGGTISVRSRLQEGTYITITIPHEEGGLIQDDKAN